MVLLRESNRASVIDVLDRVLDKGIVIDAWLRFRLVGIDLITLDARIVIASIETYLKYADSLALAELATRPSLAKTQKTAARRRPTAHVGQTTGSSRAGVA